MNTKQKPYVKAGDKVDRYLQHKIGSDWKVLLNKRRVDESTLEIKQYNNNRTYKYADQ